jgi:hypothetical protein
VSLADDATSQTLRRALVNENEHPKGALLFILVYLVLLALLWTNAYLRLWKGWGGA